MNGPPFQGGSNKGEDDQLTKHRSLLAKAQGREHPRRDEHENTKGQECVAAEAEEIGIGGMVPGKLMRFLADVLDHLSHCARQAIALANHGCDAVENLLRQRVLPAVRGGDVTKAKLQLRTCVLRGTEAVEESVRFVLCRMHGQDGRLLIYNGRVEWAEIVVIGLKGHGVNAGEAGLEDIHGGVVRFVRGRALVMNVSCEAR